MCKSFDMHQTGVVCFGERGDLGTLGKLSHTKYDVLI